MKKSHKLKLAPGLHAARAKYEEAKHKRDTAGKFADKPGEGGAKVGAKDTASKGLGVQGGAGSAGAGKAAWEASAKASGVTGADRIKLHVDSNPKKPGSASAERFAKYEDGMTVADYRAAGGTAEDLAWDRKKGFVTFHDDATYQKLSGSPGAATAEIATVGATGRLADIKAGPTEPPAPKVETETPAPKVETETPKEFTAEGKEFGEFGSGKIPKVSEDEPVDNPLHDKDVEWVVGKGNIKDAGKAKQEMMTEVSDVPVKDLKAWQGVVYKTSNFKPLPPDGEYDPIYVYKVNGQHIVRDGNHRATSAWIEGRETIKAKVLDLDSPENYKYINPKVRDKIGGSVV